MEPLYIRQFGTDYLLNSTSTVEKCLVSENFTVLVPQYAEHREVPLYMHGIYRIAGKFDGELNLANWRFWTATAKVYSR